MKKTTSSKSNYSWKTSLPAYFENMKGKDMQEQLVLYVMSRQKGKRSTLKQIQDYLRTIFKINLPQSTISGRMGDLRDKNKVAFYGELLLYRDRMRKVFEIVKKGKKKVKKTAKKSAKKTARKTAKSRSPRKKK